MTNDGMNLCLISPNPRNLGVIHYARNSEGHFVRMGRFATHQKVWHVSLFMLNGRIGALTGTSQMGKDQVLLWRYNPQQKSWSQLQSLTQLPELDTTRVACLSVQKDGEKAALLNGQGKVVLNVNNGANFEMSIETIYRRRDRELSISMGISDHEMRYDQVLLAGLPNSSEFGILNYAGTERISYRHPAQGLSIGMPMQDVVPTAPFLNNAFYCAPKTGGVMKVDITCRNLNSNPVLCLSSRTTFAKEDFGDKIQGIAYARYRDDDEEVALISNGEWAIYRKERHTDKFNRIL